MMTADIAAQTLDISSMWTWLVIAMVISVIAAAFGIYNAQRGLMPSQRQAMQDMDAQLAKHQRTIEMLQEQATTQWSQSMENKKELAQLRIENAKLKQLTGEQTVIISALQRQLAGLASGNRRTGKRLREVLTNRLNEEELRVWASDLNIPFDTLTGKTLPALIISMLDTLERYGRLDEGLQELRERRPDIPWNEVES